MVTFEEWIAKTKRIRYTIGVLLLPFLFYALLDGRAWIAWIWWIVTLAVIWLPTLRHRQRS